MLANVFNDAGLRALVGKVNMDQNSPQCVYSRQAGASSPTSERILSHNHSHNLQLRQPRMPYPNHSHTSLRHSYYTETTSSSIAETERFIHAMQSLYSSSPPAHQKLVEPCITPRFIPTCSKELLKSLASMAREKDVHVQSHLSESGDEIAFTKSIWGDREDTEIFEEVRYVHTYH